MNKPISMKYTELKQLLADTINQSDLPAFIIQLILQEFVHELSSTVAYQYQQDCKQYNAVLLAERAQVESLSIDEMMEHVEKN